MSVKNKQVKFVVLLVAGSLVASCQSNTSTTYIPKTETVVIEQMIFTPAELNVHKGDTILFINKDIVSHDVTEKDEKWKSPALNMDDSWSMVADKSFDYFCSIHVVMTGKVKVEE